MTHRVWWTSDLHLGHANILKYCPERGARWPTIAEHDAALIANWNATVAPGDIVYLLGDFSFAKPAPFFGQLNGHVSLVLGNHDESRASQLKALPFNTVSRRLWAVIDGLMVYMSHFPDDEVTGYDLYLHGHCHGTQPNGAKRCDVGVDCWNFRPCSLQQIVERIQV